MSNFRERVIAMCEAHDITTTDLGIRSGLSQSTIWRFAHGKSAIRFDHAVLIATALGISLDGPTGPDEYASEGDLQVQAEEAWSAYFNGAAEWLRPHLIRTQFVAGFIAARES